MSEPVTLNLSASSAPGIVAPVNAIKRTDAEKDGDARRGLAFAIVGCLVAAVAGAFLMFWTRGDASIDDVVKLIQAILSPVVGIVGAVTGFYFSDRQRSDERNSAAGR